MKYVFSIAIILSSFLMSAQESGDCKIQKKGVYAAKMNNESTIYIRFCSNDSVVTTSSDASPEMAKKYVVMNHSKLILSGKYNERNCMVFIKAKGMYGKVKMEGLVGDNTLALTVVNKDDNTSMDYAFKYFPD